MPGTGSAHQIRQELQRQDAGQPRAPRQQPSTRQHKPHSLARPGPGLRRLDTVPPPITPALPDGLLGMLRRVRSLPRRGPAPRGRGSHGRAAAAAAAVPDRGLRGPAGLRREPARLGTCPGPAGGQRRRLPPRRLPMMLQNARSGRGRWRRLRSYLRGLGRPLPAGGMERGREGGTERGREGKREGGRGGRAQPAAAAAAGLGAPCSPLYAPSPPPSS